jgi:hypothetical protein
LARRSLIIRTIYAICLLLATCTHVIFDVQYGMLLGGLRPLGYPLIARLFGASLTFLDPLAALLLFVRPRAGLVLCAGIIVTDVINNGWVGYMRSEVETDFLLGYLAQVAFLIFVLATIRYAWEGLPKRPPQSP